MTPRLIPPPQIRVSDLSRSANLTSTEVPQGNGDHSAPGSNSVSRNNSASATAANQSVKYREWAVSVTVQLSTTYLMVFFGFLSVRFLSSTSTSSGTLDFLSCVIWTSAKSFANMLAPYLRVVFAWILEVEAELGGQVERAAEGDIGDEVEGRPDLNIGATLSVLLFGSRSRVLGLILLLVQVVGAALAVATAYGTSVSANGFDGHGLRTSGTFLTVPDEDMDGISQLFFWFVVSTVGTFIGGFPSATKAGLRGSRRGRVMPRPPLALFVIASFVGSMAPNPTVEIGARLAMSAIHRDPVVWKYRPIVWPSLLAAPVAGIIMANLVLSRITALGRRSANHGKTR